MTIVDHSDVERVSGKAFDGNSTPTDDQVDLFCDDAQDFMEGLLGFEVEEVTETDELIDVENPTQRLLVKFPITTFTTLEERQNDTYEAKTEGPTEDFTVEKPTGIIKATSSFASFTVGPEMYRLNYKHGLLSTDNKYKTAQRCVVALAQIAVIEAEQGKDGFDTISNFSVGGLGVSFKGDQKAEKLWEDAVKFIRMIRGEWRPFSNA